MTKRRQMLSAALTEICCPTIARASWAAMRELAALDAVGLHGVTRLAVSPKGDALAIVAAPGRP